MLNKRTNQNVLFTSSHLLLLLFVVFNLQNVMEFYYRLKMIFFSLNNQISHESDVYISFHCLDSTNVTLCTFIWY